MEQLSLIQAQLSRRELFDAFIKQLLKDFRQSNFSTDFIESLKPDFQIIRNKISKALQLSETKAGTNLMQLLYRVDVSEDLLRKYLLEQENESFFNVIAGLIIKRTLQKVVTKELYRKS